MTYENLQYDVANGVATITLNRPQVYHALSSGLLQEIKQAMDEASVNTSVRVVVLTATGDKAFCAGADLKAGMPQGMTLGASLRAYYNPAILSIRHLAKPVVCRLNGLAAGAGCSLVLACDVVIASETAYLSQIFVNIGLMPDAGSTFFLPRLVGMQRAFEIASTGRKVYAQEAVQMGLIHKAVPASELDIAVAEVVEYYRHAPTQAIGKMKQIMNQSWQSTLEEMLEIEAEGQDTLAKTFDAGEGIMAFLQKRKANYRGR